MLEILRLTAENAARARPTNRRQNMSTNPIIAAMAEANGRMASGPMYIVHLFVICLCDNLYGARYVGIGIDRSCCVTSAFKPTHPFIRIHDQRCNCLVYRVLRIRKDDDSEACRDDPPEWRSSLKASPLLGFKPATNFEEGLRGFVEWYRAKPGLPTAS